ncbi:MAG: hypothetical protein C0598_07650 [Marinilabiliales bacterium]|nr:MAG: hypothetical protein C0598_07650 [Marinilabiliales bacterium]
MRPHYRNIIILMSLSLLGIILVQALWIDYAIKKEKSVFNKTVYKSLKETVDKLERKEMFYFMNEKIELPPAPKAPVINYKWESQKLDSLIKLNSDIHKKINDKNRKVHTIKSNNGQTVIVVSDSTENSKATVKISANFDDENTFFDNDVEFILGSEIDAVEHIADSIQRVFEIQAVKEKVVEEKMEQFQKNMDKWVMEYSFNNEREELLIGNKNLDTILSKSLKNNGIDLDYQYQILEKNEAENTLIKSMPDTSSVLDLEYETQLYPNDLFKSNTYISIGFPSLNSMIYKSLYLLIIGSLVFTTIILLTFGTTLYYIQKQKKISEVKSDFINNMTHEFKTPIATISLASSAIESPKVSGNSEKTNYYVDIIKKENKRMNSQVERVLQMAQIDNDDFSLNLEENDVHDIIENVANVLNMRAEDKEGRIITSLKASCYKIKVDEIHFANVLNNLIDNALKYNDKKPEILIETSTRNNKFILEVSDNGMGMGKEIQKHIFDKFYRRPSGNIHNIKGFGLGLSYVKAIVESHGGEIFVNSEVGNGSKFTISLICKS